VLRANLIAGLENVALWHERDISHSSVERIVLPDSCQLAYYLLEKMRAVIEGMRVHADRMRENLDRSYGLVFSQPVLLALVASGLSRDDAYRIVQEHAMVAWEEGKPFRALLEGDARVTLSAEALDEAFSLERALRNVGAVFDSLKEVTG
jgi:adenylosuccinate lyase